MDNKGKQKLFKTSHTINIFEQADAHIGTRVELASAPILSVSMLNTTVKNREETERSYVRYGPFSE
jgi:hypothetical protein